jgi:hypothetical protein
MGKIFSRAFTGPTGILTRVKDMTRNIVKAQSGTQIPTTPAPLVFNNPERAARIEGSLKNAAFGGADIRTILEQLLQSKFLAEGGRVGYEMGGDVMNPYGETIKYNPNLGQFVNATNQQPVDQTQLLQWSAQNPEPLKTRNQMDPALLGQLIQSLKS